jgi:hypothetical protein
MKNLSQFYRALVLTVGLLALYCGIAQAVPLQTSAPITGEIQAITLTTPGDVWSGGTMTIGGQTIILPRNLLINLPNDYQSLQQLYANAPPACLATGETGLAKNDRCASRATGAQATIVANRTDSGNIIAGQVDVFKALETVTGTVTYISYTDGYFRVNGVSGDSSTGVMVRVNDPPVGTPALGRHTIQKGLGCAANNTQNCSPDIRFKVDPDNYTFSYITGYPACIPTTANGLGDPNCPDANRPPIINITTGNPFANPPVAADSRRFAPVTLGDSIKADGSFETVGGVTFLSAWSVRVLVDLTTRTVDPNTAAPDLTQPNYLIINEASWDGAAYPAGRVRGRLLTNSTIHDSEIDFYSIHYDPVNNAAHERPLYTTRFNKQFGVVVFNVANGVSDSQIRYDFFPGAPGTPGSKVGGGNAGANQEPCASFLGTEPKATGIPVADLAAIGITVSSFCPDPTGLGLVDNFNLMVPVFREVMARSTRSETRGAGAVTGVALDIHGRPTQSGFYKLPTTISYGAFEDINLGMAAFPNSFTGTPWLMDRRLSPNGCVGACENVQQPLSPFPFEGIDPRNVAPTFGFFLAGTPTSLPTPNRMFAFMDTAGNMTGLLAWPPANPPAFPITATPGLSIFPPFADEDAASTKAGVPVIVPVLANDVAMFGTIDPTSVKIATAPATGAVQVNPDGTITYTPTPTATGTITFTYTVANNFGAVSLPGTVTISIVAGPTANDDAASVPAGSIKEINLTANDVAGTSPINLTSLLIVSPLPAACGILTNQNNGTVSLAAPAAVPAAGTLCSFQYTVTDSSTPPLISRVATATITITAPNTPPVATNIFANAISGTTVTINTVGNVSSASSTINPASLVVDLPSGGTALANANGTISYTAPAAPGTYFFAYTMQDNLNPPLTSNPGLVLVTVTATDVPPVANNDAAGTVVNTPVTINVLANDISATSTLDPTTVTVTAPTGGTAVANANGTVTYTAPATPGSYAFTYTVKDKFVPPSISNVATVLVTVTGANVAPVANNDAAATTPGATITINVLANDTSSTSTLNPASLVLTAPTGGTAIANANGTVTYTAPALAGTYTFTYTVKDIFTTPATSNVATVTITVVAVNIPPVANNDTAATTTGVPVTIPVTANDTSATSTINPASLTLVTAPASGTATPNANGSFTYTPGAAGTFTFSYTVQDNATTPATSNVATVTVTVTAPVVNPPIAANDTAATAFNTPVTITVLANDTAGTNPINTASVTIGTAAANGTATANAAGTITYTPNATFSGTDSFTYTVKDNNGLSSNAATVTVTVAAAPAQPLAITRAQFTLNGATWRVDGTVTPATAAGANVSLYNNSTVGTALLATVPVAGNGSFTWSSPGGAQQPNAARKMSVQSATIPTVKLEGVTITVR